MCLNVCVHRCALHPKCTHVHVWCLCSHRDPGEGLQALQGRKHPGVVSLQGSAAESQLLCAAREVVVGVGGRLEVREGAQVSPCGFTARFYPLPWERPSEETEAPQGRTRSQKPEVPAWRLSFPLNCLSGNCSIKRGSKDAFHAFDAKRSNPTRLACEGLHPGQRRDLMARTRSCQSAASARAHSSLGPCIRADGQASRVVSDPCRRTIHTQQEWMPGTES